MDNTSKVPQSSVLAPKSPSWVAERDAIRLYGDRKTRAILAIYHARRSAKKAEFFVHPDIARVNGLCSSDLSWALDRLEGKLVKTIHSKSGKYRMVRLLPAFEEAVASPRATRQSTGNASLDAYPGEERVEINQEEVMAQVAAMR